MYGEIVKNLEVSKFTLLNNKPLLNIIDTPTLPLKVNNLPVFLAFILFSILGFVVCSTSLIINKIISEELS